MHYEPKISIITINYNGLDDTCELLESLKHLKDIEIVVVDNASSHDEASVLEKRFPTAKVVRSDANLGFAGGNNLGIKNAHGKYLLFINNDTVLKTDGNLDALTERLDSSDNIGVVCPKLRFSWDNNPIQFAGYTPLSAITMRNSAIGCDEEDKGQYDTPHPTPYAHGAAMMVKREALEKVGPMPECYFLYYEELDWSMMFTRAGYKIWYEPRCTVYHKESRATGQASPLKTYYLTRNRLIFAKRNIGAPQKFLTYCYLISIFALRDIIKHTLCHRPDLRKSVTKGIADFLRKKDNIQKSL